MDTINEKKMEKNLEIPTKEEFALIVVEAFNKKADQTGFKGSRGWFKDAADRIADIYENFKEKAVEFLKDGDKVEDLLLRVEAKLKEVPNLGDKLAYIPQLVLMVRSYILKEYTDIEMVEIVGIIAALIYFVSPIDVLPDGIPGLGFLDDAIVVGIILKWCQDDIDKYMDWLKNKR